MMCRGQPLKPEDCYSMASRTNILINVFFFTFSDFPSSFTFANHCINDEQFSLEIGRNACLDCQIFDYLAALESFTDE